MSRVASTGSKGFGLCLPWKSGIGCLSTMTAPNRPSPGLRRTSPALRARGQCWHEPGVYRGLSTTAVAMTRHKIVLFGPSLDAVSGMSTHVRMLLASDLARDYELLHFQVGSEGRRENALQKLMRFTLSPLQLALFL